MTNATRLGFTAMALFGALLPSALLMAARLSCAADLLHVCG